MARLTETLMKRGLELMGDPRVAKLIQDPRVMKAVMTAMSVPGRVQTFTSEQIERVVKALDLATEEDVRDLRRTVRRLEDEITRLQRDQGNRKGPQ